MRHDHLSTREPKLAIAVCCQAEVVEEAVPSREDKSIRWDVVDRVRAEIAAGTYECEEKIAAALDRFLHEDFRG